MGVLPSSPLPRVRTLTLLVAASLSPMMRMKGDLGVGEIADFGLHHVVTFVEFDADAGGFELLFDLAGVVQVLFGDGHESDLNGREPEGERAGVMFDEHAEEAFYTAEQRAGAP